uniref:Uncharacterized protein n=1 Tax=Oryza rufipogon TaxID=4529 RepID=A0A0E0P080_ORYRU
MENTKVAPLVSPSPFSVLSLPAAVDPRPTLRAPPLLHPGLGVTPSCRTRSSGTLEWTPVKTLALMAKVVVIDDGWSHSVSAFQKWAVLAENLAGSYFVAATS